MYELMFSWGDCAHAELYTKVLQKCIVVFYPSFFMVPKIPEDLEIGLLSGNSLDTQMLLVISVS